MWWQYCDNGAAGTSVIVCWLQKYSQRVRIFCASYLFLIFHSFEESSGTVPANGQQVVSLMYNPQLAELGTEVRRAQASFVCNHKRYPRSWFGNVLKILCGAWISPPNWMWWASFSFAKNESDVRMNVRFFDEKVYIIIVFCWYCFANSRPRSVLVL